MMYAFLKVLSYGLSFLPGWFLAFMAKVMAIVCFDIIRLRRKIILKNLKIAFGQNLTEAQRVRVARQSICHFWQTIFETLISVRRPIAKEVAVEGEEHLHLALDKKQGAYVLCFHIGNWEAMGAKFSQSLVPAHVIVKKVGSPGLNRFVEELREKNGFHWIRRDQKGDGFKGIQNVLKKGEIVGFAFDQARPGEPRLPFFGHPAKTNTSLAAIWQKSPAPIVPAYIYRKGFGRHVLCIEPELNLELGESPQTDIVKHSMLFNEKLESIIKQKPEHYFWLHNRWKT